MHYIDSGGLNCQARLIGYHVSAQADMGAMLVPSIKRVDGRTISFSADDYIEGFKTQGKLIASAPAR
jgi:D-aminopeptidase